MIENPSKPLWVCPLTDPAIADGEEHAKLLQSYRQTRTYEDLAALPLVEGERPVFWRLKPLTPSQRAECVALGEASRQCLAAFRLSVDARMEGASIGPEGPTGGSLTERPRNASPTDLDAWIADQVAVGGGQIVDELGMVALLRAVVHPKARALFGAR